MPQPVDEPDDGRSSWSETVREVHRLAAATHASYQRTMTDVHLAYLSAVDRSLNNGVSPAGGLLASGGGVNGTHDGIPPAVAPIEVPPPDLPDLARFTPDVDAFRPIPPSTNGHGAEPVPAPSAGAAQTERTEELIALTLEVVAEKTGYPVEILRPDMHLQTDLGIDSIKRVEVLSALRDRVEGLSTLDAGELGRLQSIGEIAERLVAEVGG